MNVLEKFKWVYGSKNNRELTERYNQWAQDYDCELMETLGRPTQEPCIDFLIKYAAKDARILDAGAGTGIIGEHLHKIGYGNLIAMDLSEGMLTEARKKNVYKELHQMVLGESLDFQTDSFDTVIAVGVFTYGHAPSGSFDELIRITKPKGHIIFTIRPEFYEDTDFKTKQSAMEASCKWEQLEKYEYQPLPEQEPDFYFISFVYRVL